MMLTDLAAACRKSGLPVVEVDGWRTRGHGDMAAVQTIVCHHTATAASAAGNYPSLGIVRDGRSDLPGPLAQLGLGRDGTVYVIAAGVAYHAGEVSSVSYDNWHAVGIEAEADGVHEWPDAQVDAYARLCKALCEHYGLEVGRVLGHKEVCAPAGRKIDPNFDMDAFRKRVRNAQGDDMFSDDDRKMLARIEDRQKRQGETLRKRLADLRDRVKGGRAEVRELGDELDALVDELAEDNA